MDRRFLLLLLLLLLLIVSVFLTTAVNAAGSAANKSNIFSSKLIHRFSDEAFAIFTSQNRKHPLQTWPTQKSLDHMRLLLNADMKRQRLKLGTQKDQLLVPSQGGRTLFFGNDWAWLHYTWIDIGTPNVSFLVALDTGSDLFWVPCDCIQCASLSSSAYHVLDRDLSEYNPSQSNTSKLLPCSHQLCELGPNCKGPLDHCPYSASYDTDDTSSSGFLFEDQLHFASASGHPSKGSVQASVVIGCGSKQTGSFMDGSAPDGLMGLGPGGLSVPSLLAKSGLVPHSFSFCFDKTYSGSIFFGDKGPAAQRFTPFLPLEGKYIAYIVEVEHFCVGSSCLKQTGFQAQVDSGSSFTYLPHDIYQKIIFEFENQMNATTSGIEGFPYCYRARSEGQPGFPSMKFNFATNQSFVIENPMFHIVSQGVDLYCLGIHPMDGRIGVIGQNLMMGYRLVFDWEDLKLGWSHSNCRNIGEVHLTPPSNDIPTNPLPTNEQQRTPGGHAVAPAVAGKATPKPSAAPPHLIHYQHRLISSLLLLLSVWLHNLI